jgi:hypothetical protein
LLHLQSNIPMSAYELSSWVDGRPRRVRLPKSAALGPVAREAELFGTLCDFCNALYFFESHRNPALISIAMSPDHNNGGAS